ncbi:unnamed protein product [Prorocentrum cordatum]|uniref:PCIF1 WW domain-containing protein n=1 Tax=Prorocentrum cordatum TaxID=2364126 RepID=A0ABN9XSR5_9DINO|nr:unnamed protein product [Polarella glacialis]
MIGSPPPTELTACLVSKVLFTHNKCSTSFRHGTHSGRSIDWLVDSMVQGKIQPTDETMTLRGVRFHGEIYSLNNRHAQALMCYAEHCERAGLPTPTCQVSVWPLVPGLRLDDTRQDVFEKFSSAFTSATRGRVMAPARTPSSTTPARTPDGAQPAAGWMRCGQCHALCANLADCLLLWDVHQPKDGTVQERLKRVPSLMCFTTEQCLENGRFAPHPEAGAMPFKLHKVHCGCCSAALGNVQNTLTMEGDWSKVFDDRSVGVKCNTVALQFQDCADRFVQTEKWVSYRFAMGLEPLIRLGTLTMAAVRRQGTKYLKEIVPKVPATTASHDAALAALPARAASHLRALADGVLQKELTAFGEHLEDCLAESVRVCDRFLQFRDLAWRHLATGAVASEYEFNNAYSRFYMAARNTVGPASDCDGFDRAFVQMQRELKEKRMQELPWTLTSFCDLESLVPEHPGSVAVLGRLEESSEGTLCLFRLRCSFPRAELRCPSERARELRGRAEAFVRRFCPRALRGGAPTEAAERVFKTLVLNYVLSASGLHWGVGPGFYAGAGAASHAVMECYASPFNHSLEVFCSQCVPVDIAFGSLGSFHSPAVDEFLREVPAGSLLVANPPYIEAELAACAKRTCELVDRWGLLGAGMYPDWRDSDGVMALKAAVAQRGGRVVKLAHSKFACFDYELGQEMPARFASLGFVFGKEAGNLGALKRVVEKLEGLRRTTRKGKGKGNGGH